MSHKTWFFIRRIWGCGAAPKRSKLRENSWNFTSDARNRVVLGRVHILPVILLRILHWWSSRRNNSRFSYPNRFPKNLMRLKNETDIMLHSLNGRTVVERADVSLVRQIRRSNWPWQMNIIKALFLNVPSPKYVWVSEGSNLAGSELVSLLASFSLSSAVKPWSDSL